MTRQTGRRGSIGSLALASLALLGGALGAQPGHAAGASAAGPLYDIIYLGTLGGYTYATAINQVGEVAGFSVVPGGATHAFWEYPQLTGEGGMGAPFDMGTLGGAQSEATALTNSSPGEVVGWSETSAGQQHAFRGGANGVIFVTGDLGTLGGGRSFANGVNDKIERVGYSRTTAGDSHAFRTAPGQPINPATDDLGTLGGRTSQANGINSAGQVVGWSGTSSGSAHAFRTAPEADGTPGLIDLGTLGGTNSYAMGINDAGQAVGYAQTSAGTYHAFRTGPNRPIDAATDDLGTLGGRSYARGINDAGQVVGYSETSTSPGTFRAFLYSDGPGLRDLNDLIPPGTGWVLETAMAINDAGQIVGNGTFNGQPRAFALNPRPVAPTVTATAMATTAPPTATATATASSMPTRTPAAPPSATSVPPSVTAVPPSATRVPTPAAAVARTRSRASSAPCLASAPHLRLAGAPRTVTGGGTLLVSVVRPPHARLALSLRLLAAATARPGHPPTARLVAVYALTADVTTDRHGQATVRLAVRYATRHPLAGAVTATLHARCGAASATVGFTLAASPPRPRHR